MANSTQNNNSPVFIFTRQSGRSYCSICKKRVRNQRINAERNCKHIQELLNIG